MSKRKKRRSNRKPYRYTRKIARCLRGSFIQQIIAPLRVQSQIKPYLEDCLPIASKRKIFHKVIYVNQLDVYQPLEVSSCLFVVHSQANIQYVISAGRVPISSNFRRKTKPPYHGHFCFWAGKPPSVTGWINRLTSKSKWSTNKKWFGLVCGIFG